MSGIFRYLTIIAAIFLSFSSAYATCLPIAGAPSLAPKFMPASLRQVSAVPANHLRITFVGHASFLIESPEGVKVLTDYNGYVVPDVVPDIVTMNNSHQSHYTNYVDSRIKHVLRGWDPDGGIARHNLVLKDVRVRNVPTNINDYTGRLANGNSMFVIESNDLCVVHISHLHHVLSVEQLGELGRVDIAFAPIDGRSTMTYSELFKVLAQIKPRLIVPMHYHMFGAAEEFTALAKAHYAVRVHKGNSIVVSSAVIPSPPQVLFLEAQ